MHRGSIFWGIVLVLFGGLLLGQNMGLIPPTVNVWAIFWPLLLIAFGVGMLMRSAGSRSFTPPAAPFSSGDRTAAPVEAGTTAGAAAAPVSHPGEAVRLPLGTARRARMRFHYGAGELRVDANAAPDELFSGTFGGGLEHQVSLDGDEAIVDLRVPGGAMTLMSPFDEPHRLDWTVGLNPYIPLVLDLEVGASRNLLNLRDLQVKELRLQTGASATEIDLPNRAGECRVNLHSGMASVEARVPENVSAWIRTRGGLSSTEVDTLRFPQVGSNEYRSPDYEVAANKIYMEIETGLGAVHIH